MNQKPGPFLFLGTGASTCSLRFPLLRACELTWCLGFLKLSEEADFLFESLNSSLELVVLFP